MRTKMTPGGKCRCGKRLPDVRENETPYQFCSQKCKDAERRREATRGKK